MLPIAKKLGGICKHFSIENIVALMISRLVSWSLRTGLF